MIEFLEKVSSQKRKEVKEKKKLFPFSSLYQRVKDLPFSSQFSRSILTQKSIIAEIKRASPSKGILFSGRSVEEFGRIYETHGASAVSLVTDEKYFKGAMWDLQKLKACIRIPILRKDFIIDEYQILESKQSGADAVLLISSLLSSRKLTKFLDLFEEMRMDAVVEVHSEDELKGALDAGAKIIGINNRDLRTLTVDLNSSKRLLPLIPDSKIKIVESGIKDEKDLLSYSGFNVNAFLIGEALVTASCPGEVLKRLCLSLRRQ